jgi:hypothetical protein
MPARASQQTPTATMMPQTTNANTPGILRMNVYTKPTKMAPKNPNPKTYHMLTIMSAYIFSV